MELKRVEQHPYLQDIELCENLIFYCTKVHRAATNKDQEEEPADANVD